MCVNACANLSAGSCDYEDFVFFFASNGSPGVAIFEMAIVHGKGARKKQC